MKLPVPFIENPANDCGPIALQIVLQYYGQDVSLERLKRLCRSQHDGVTMTLGIACAAQKLGYKTIFLSESLGQNNFEDIEYYQIMGDEDLEALAQLIKKEAYDLGVDMQEKTITLLELLKYLDEGTVPIVLVDWGTIAGKEFTGHIVPIVGYDKKNVYIHQPGPANPTPFLRVEKSLFDAARKKRGTDQDIVLILDTNK